MFKTIHSFFPAQVRHLALFCAPLLLLSASAADESSSPSTSATSMTENPLLKESALDFHYPPFDRIKDADFA
ncbi:MAG TPA: hypothetical protein VNW28_08730, partial [Chthoniobacterales bacterium]|nr:hypothetical protein [Chthoniobacterales bacterium]